DRPAGRRPSARRRGLRGLELRAVADQHQPEPRHQGLGPQHLPALPRRDGDHRARAVPVDAVDVLVVRRAGVAARALVVRPPARAGIRGGDTGARDLVHVRRSLRPGDDHWQLLAARRTGHRCAGRSAGGGSSVSGRTARWLLSLVRSSAAPRTPRLTIVRHHRVYADSEKPLYRLGVSERVLEAQLATLAAAGLAPVTVGEG